MDFLAKFHLGGIETEYWRGACEEAEGHPDAALAIWASIPRGSSRFANATLRRARLALERGRLAVAEEALESASFPPSSPAHEIREHELEQLNFLTGRSYELQRRLRKEWAGAKNQADILRRHWLIDEIRSYPAGALRTRLDELGRLAPDDDRVWLGRASLAIHTTQLADADAWLKKCQARRPADTSVWRARLDWARASDNLTEALAAMSHLPAREFPPESLLSLRAWLAAQVANEGAESQRSLIWSSTIPATPRLWRD